MRITWLFYHESISILVLPTRRVRQSPRRNEKNKKTRFITKNMKKAISDTFKGNLSIYHKPPPPVSLAPNPCN